MARLAVEAARTAEPRMLELLGSFPGRLEFAGRLAAICALTTLVVAYYETPEPALTAYVAFFLVKPDRVSSILTGFVFLVVITLVVGLVLLLAMMLIDNPMGRVATMALISFCLMFLASASKLKPLAGTLALIVGYALDVISKAPEGELATRALLYAWLLVGIPVAVSTVVNLIAGPAPRTMAEGALADRLEACGDALRAPAGGTIDRLRELIGEGGGEIATWLRMSALEHTSSPADVAALKQAHQSTAALMPLVMALASASSQVPAASRLALASTFTEMVAILRRGGYPVNIDTSAVRAGVEPAPSNVILDEIDRILATFAEPARPALVAPAKTTGGFFAADAFTDPAHVYFALKVTAAAMLCYVTYTQLVWPGIHTCLITCYIVSQGSVGETVEKLTLRLAGCLIGAASGLAAIILLTPHLTDIGELMALVFAATLASGWIAAGSPRIAYVGFQIAFAFLLCVVQGASPAFDMVVARDRVIGIIFGNLVASLIFAQVLPASIGPRIDRALSTLLSRLGALCRAGGLAERCGIASEMQTNAASIRQDLEIAGYEPASIGPATAWIAGRRRLLDSILTAQGALLPAAGSTPRLAGELAERVEALAGQFTQGSVADLPRQPSLKAPGSSAAEPRRADSAISSSESVRAALANLEQAVLRASPGIQKES